MKLPYPPPSTIRAGLSLPEILVSMVVGSVIFFGVAALLTTGMRGYQKVASGVAEVANTSTALTLLKRDLDWINLALPISYGDGESDRGWDLTKGLYRPWDAELSYGRAFPVESRVGFPNDRLGFYITLPEDLAGGYGGKNVAHVLYFTAVTSDVLAEDLSPAVRPALRYSRKLYRLFTPPDRVYERLNMLDPAPTRYQSKGLAAIPRGPNYTGKSVVSDDAGWTFLQSPEPASISMVAQDVAQFQVTLSAYLEVRESTVPSAYIQDFASAQSMVEPAHFVDQEASFHDLLASVSPVGTHHLRPAKLAIIVSVCPALAARSLRSDEWDIALEGGFLARKNVTPNPISLSHKLAY